MTESVRAQEQSKAELAKEAELRARAEAEVRQFRQEQSAAQRESAELAAQRLRFQEEIKKLAAAQERANVQLQIEYAGRKRAQEENEQLREHVAESGRASEYLRNQRNLLEAEVKRCGDEIAALTQQHREEAGRGKQAQAENTPGAGTNSDESKWSGRPGPSSSNRN